MRLLPLASALACCTGKTSSDTGSGPDTATQLDTADTGSPHTVEGRWVFEGYAGYGITGWTASSSGYTVFYDYWFYCDPAYLELEVAAGAVTGSAECSYGPAPFDGEVDGDVVDAWAYFDVCDLTLHLTYDPLWDELVGSSTVCSGQDGASLTFVRP